MPTTDRWPSLELVVFDRRAAPARLPAESRLFREGVPKDLFGVVYRALPSLSAIDHGLVRFGEWGSTHDICVDPPTGRVFQVHREVAGDPVLVNASLDHFTEFVRVVLARFPFYPASGEPEECDAVGHELAAGLARIDPAALAVGSFWGEFISDLKNGDYSTEDVLG